MKKAEEYRSRKRKREREKGKGAKKWTRRPPLETRYSRSDLRSLERDIPDSRRRAWIILGPLLTRAPLKNQTSPPPLIGIKSLSVAGQAAGRNLRDFFTTSLTTLFLSRPARGGRCWWPSDTGPRRTSTSSPCESLRKRKGGRCNLLDYRPRSKTCILLLIHRCNGIRVLTGDGGPRGIWIGVLHVCIPLGFFFFFLWVNRAKGGWRECFRRRVFYQWKLEKLEGVLLFFRVG